VDLVVDDQTPVPGIEQVQVGVGPFPLGREDLVGGDRDGSDLLTGSGVLPDLRFGQGRSAQQFGLPLSGRDRVGHQDEGGGTQVGHRGRADDRLAGATRKYDDTRSTREEPVDGLLLVGPQRPTLRGQRDLMGLAVDISREILGGPAQRHEDLLESAAFTGVDPNGVAVEPVTDQGLDLLAVQHLVQDGTLLRRQDQPVGGVHLQLKAAVARHRVGDIDQQRVGDREPAVRDECVHDLLSVETGGAGVPQPEVGHPVGVDVFRRSFQFGERGDRVATQFELFVVDFQQQRLVALHDEGATGHPTSITRPSQCCRRDDALQWDRADLTCGVVERAHVPGLELERFDEVGQPVPAVRGEAQPHLLMARDGGVQRRQDLRRSQRSQLRRTRRVAGLPAFHLA